MKFAIVSVLLFCAYITIAVATKCKPYSKFRLDSCTTCHCSASGLEYTCSAAECNSKYVIYDPSPKFRSQRNLRIPYLNDEIPNSQESDGEFSKINRGFNTLDNEGESKQSVEYNSRDVDAEQQQRFEESDIEPSEQFRSYPEFYE
ncbi:uncharacterized protein LOC109609159 [Aethina tumida]|uniref:uncharacterized protein LOC109609159 n=1 Tax=Aethina tumida TaxID=116153 RepID=UPI00096B3756|nr:uncharacterized protein LOC109609159 [Aethina tumida]